MRPFWVMTALLILACPAALFAEREVVSDFTDQNLPVLNQELRRINRELETLNSWASAKSAATLNISAGAITADRTAHAVDTEGAASTDDLVTINGGTDGNILVLYPADSARTVVVKDGTGNIQISGDFTMDNAQDTITLIKRGLSWQRLSSSDNGS